MGNRKKQTALILRKARLGKGFTQQYVAINAKLKRLLALELRIDDIIIQMLLRLHGVYAQLTLHRRLGENAGIEHRFGHRTPLAQAE